MSVVTDPPTRPVVGVPKRGGSMRLVKLFAWVALGHVVLILILSPQLYWPSRNTPEALFERGEQAMKEGRHAEAMDLFRKVMDQQPKPPPIYEKATENHRLADRLARDAATKSAEAAKAAAAATTKPAMTTTTQPVKATVTTQPSTPYIPPELRPR